LRLRCDWFRVRARVGLGLRYGLGLRLRLGLGLRLGCDWFGVGLGLRLPSAH